MTLTEVLDLVYRKTEWRNSLRPYFVSGITQTPYQAYLDLKPDIKPVIHNMIGHVPTRNEE